MFFASKKSSGETREARAVPQGTGSRALWIWGCCLACCLPGAAMAGGILIYSKPGSTYMNLIEYASLRAPAAHLTDVITKDGRKSQLLTSRVMADIPYPEDADKLSAQGIRQLIAQIDIYSGQYPQFSRQLAAVRALWEKALVAKAAEEERLRQERETEEVARAAEEAALQARKDAELRARRAEEENARRAKAEKTARQEAARSQLAARGVEIIADLAKAVENSLAADSLNAEAISKALGGSEGIFSGKVRQRLRADEAIAGVLDSGWAPARADEAYLLSLDGVLRAADLAGEGRNTDANRTLEKALESGEKADLRLRTAAHIKLAVFSGYLKQRISESDRLRKEAEELVKRGEIGEAIARLQKAGQTDRRSGDEAAIEALRGKEKEAAMKTLGL